MFKDKAISTKAQTGTLPTKVTGIIIYSYGMKNSFVTALVYRLLSETFVR